MGEQRDSPVPIRVSTLKYCPHPILLLWKIKTICKNIGKSSLRDKIIHSWEQLPYIKLKEQVGHKIQQSTDNFIKQTVFLFIIIYLSDLSYIYQSIIAKF